MSGANREAWEGEPRMKIRELSIALLVAALPVTVSSTAFALPINFTDGSWNAAQGAASFTMHSSNIDLFASGGTLTVNYVGGPSGDNSGDDGLGINDDEITQGGAERLTVLFSAPVTLDSVKLTDFFLNEGPTGQSEVGLYSLNGGRLRLSPPRERPMVPSRSISSNPVFLQWPSNQLTTVGRTTR